MKKIQRPTPEENEAINKAIASDPDTFDPKDGFDHLVRVDPKKLGRPVEVDTNPRFQFDWMTKYWTNSVEPVLGGKRG